MHINTYRYMCMYMCMYMHMYTHTHMYTYMYSCSRTRTQTYRHRHTYYALYMQELLGGVCQNLRFVDLETRLGCPPR